MSLISANGVELFYDLTGPEGAPVVAFSTSIGTTLEMWDAQARALSGRYRCLRYDTRGHGRSQVLDQPVTIDNLADERKLLRMSPTAPSQPFKGLLCIQNGPHFCAVQCLGGNALADSAGPVPK